MEFLTGEALQAKGDMILITNNCNLSCGGCNQFCPNIRSKDVWNIPLDQLRDNISTMSEFHGDLILTGGEPTQHPGWEEIKQILWNDFPHVQFWVFTNHPYRCQCDVPEPEGNIHYHSDNGMRDTGHYVPTLVAPSDIYQIPERMFYVWMAGKHCWMLSKNCSGMLYDNKAYFCQVAAAFERVTETNYGWEFEPGVDPFDRTDEQIIKQAVGACFRCSFCLDPGTREDIISRQLISNHSLMTPTNANYFRRKVALFSEQDRVDILPDAIEVGQAWWRLMKLETRREERVPIDPPKPRGEDVPEDD